MGTTAEKLTEQEFGDALRSRKAVLRILARRGGAKSPPDWIHGLLQKILMDLLSRAGYKAASEVKLRIDLDLHLIPDVIATRGRIELRYPTRALDVVLEILSDDDPMSRVLSKCRIYQGWGFEQIYVIDPGGRTVFRWNSGRLDPSKTLAGVAVEEIWMALDRELQ
jgi:Uma2 family endonuclease